MNYSFILIGFAFCLGIFFFWFTQKVRLKGFRKIAEQIIAEAHKEAEINKKKAEEEQKKTLDQAQRDWKKNIEHHYQQLTKEEHRLNQREDRLDARLQLIEKKMQEMDKKENQLQNNQKKVEELKIQCEQKERLYCKKIEELAQLNEADAKQLLFNQVSDQIKSDTSKLIKNLQKETLENSDQEARRIIATAINRLVIPCTSEHTITMVHLPNEEIKGRIIGREGRNIRTLELATGVNFIIDETPNAVIISGFDPIRKHIARMTLGELVQDGRIHPTKIEEIVKKHELLVDKEIKIRGEDAAIRAGILNLHQELQILLGKLHFRFSLGQNVLEHSFEVAQIMGMMASEMGLNSSLAKRIGLLHDIGKAVSFEVEGTHALIGRDMALKFGESLEVANGIGCHHFEIEALTIEGSLCSAADALSAARPGARIEAIEQYFKRLQKLEELSKGFNGVEKAYAMQAGKEVRVVVIPDEIDDTGTLVLAREIAKKIEVEMNYPGKIKVTVIREKRSTEYAL